MAELPELIKVYEECFDLKKKYCMLCFRTEDVRKLVQSNFMNKLIKELRFDGYWSTYKTLINLCYICERKAEKAYKFTLMLQMARRIAEYYATLKHIRGWRTKVKLHLKNGISFQSNVLKQSKNHEIELSQLRELSKLVQTEILTVSSNKPGISEPKDEQDLDSDEVQFVPEKVDTIEILDDEKNDKNEELSAVLKNVYAIRPTGEPHGVQRLNNESLYLHPVVKTDNKLCVPSLNCHIAGGLLYSDINSRMHLIPALAADIDGKLNIIKDQNNILNLLKTYNFKSFLSVATTGKDLSTVLTDTGGTNVKLKDEVITDVTNNYEVVIDNNIATNTNDVTPINNVQSVVTDKLTAELGQADKQMSDLTDDKCKVTVTSESNKKAVKNKNCLKLVEPAKKTAKIDWEDKIPMDVISCVEPTDPLLVHNDPLAVNNFGILDVHSLVCETTDVIDLS